MDLDELREAVARGVYGVAEKVAPTHAERYRIGRWVLRYSAPFEVEGLGSDWIAKKRWPTPGIDYRVAAQLELLARWAELDQTDFDQIRHDDRINAWAPAPNLIDNGFYPTPDPEVYWRLIGEQKPQRIVEIGGGYSTLCARAAIDALGLDTELVVVDPEPRTDVEAAASSVINSRVEDLTPAELVTGPGQFLFIDSSHIVRTGGDLPFLFGEVIPLVPVDTTMHVHDIYLPFGYPPKIAGAMWTEQYLLQVLLANSSRYEVLFATHLMTRDHLEAMRAAFGPAVGTDPRAYGQGFWLRVIAEPTV